MGHPLIRHFNYRQETLAAAHGWHASKHSKLQPHTCTNQVLTTTKNDLWGVQAMKRPFLLQLPPWFTRAPFNKDPCVETLLSIT